MAVRCLIDRSVLRRLAPLCVAAALLAGCRPDNPPRTLSGNFHHVTPEGWRGRRFTDNNRLLAEEYDTNNDQLVDLWRYYDQGRLVAEERDLLGRGGVNYISAWDIRGQLLSAARDRDGRGTFDTQVETLSTSGRGTRWRIAEDRNGDGLADRLLEAEGPPDLFRLLGIDLATVPSVIEAVPVQYWRETRADNAFVGTLGYAVRYRNGRPHDRVVAYDAAGRPARTERIPEGADPETLAVADGSVGIGAPREVESTAASEGRRRRRERRANIDEESTAGAVPRNMLFRAPGQL